MSTSFQSTSLNQVLVTILTCLSLVISGAVACWAILWDDPPSILATPHITGTAPVTELEFSDAQLVTVEASMLPLQAMLSPAGGIITSSTCSAGGTVTSGQSVFSINGSPVIALATSVPFWRDIHLGDTGMDVIALASELARLGRFDGTIENLASYDILESYWQLATELGISVESNDFTEPIPMSQVTWLPQDGLQISSCDSIVGSSVTPGQQVAGFVTALASAWITTDISGLTPGPRVLQVDNMTISVDPDGRVTEPAELTALSTTHVAMLATGTEQNTTFQATYVLLEPLLVSVIPPSAIRPGITGRGCVVGDDRTTSVTIVASNLGQSYVLFDGPSPGSVVLNPPEDLTCP